MTIPEGVDSELCEIRQTPVRTKTGVPDVEQRAHAVFTGFGVHSDCTGYAVFVRGTRDGRFTIIILHVDDNNVLSNSKVILRDF